MEKRIVKFFSEGVRVEGDLFLPDGLKAGERRPGIVLCHGFTGIRSVILGDYAKVFVEAGRGDDDAFHAFGVKGQVCLVQMTFAFFSAEIARS